MHPKLSELLKEPWRGASSPPQVTLVSGHLLPFEEAIAAARSCYSAKGLVLPEEIIAEKGFGAAEKLLAFASDLHRSGHHTVFQHAHFTFALKGVSRLFVWSFLHAHPFYNSEQVSQRYVRVGEGSFYLPQRAAHDRRYIEIAHAMHRWYEEFTQALIPRVEALFFKRFPGRANRPALWRKAIVRRAQEIARYLLPQAAHTHLHHTISGLTLMRYVRMLYASEAQPEARFVVARMVEEILKISPEFVELFHPPLEESELPLQSSTDTSSPSSSPFPDLLREPEVVLLSATPNAQELLGMALELCGMAPLVKEPHPLLDPLTFPTWCHTLNINYHHPLMRIFLHIHYVFRKVLSLAADSQNQRHRFSHASRPQLSSLFSRGFKAIVPLLIGEDSELLRRYREVLSTVYSELLSCEKKGWSRFDLLYLLPNATAIEIIESTDYLSLHHKHRMRLCYNAQEEIWRLSYEEARLVREIHPWLGEWLLPPCAHRAQGGLRPICPEGSRFCGEKVWQLPFSEYARAL